jgi:hypothetical protein
MKGLAQRAWDIPSELELRAYGLFVDALQASTLSRDSVHRYCVGRATVAFERETALDKTAAWLRRARYVVPALSQQYHEFRKRFDVQYRQTTNAPPLPEECAAESFRGAIVGEGERGHTNVELLNRFAGRVHARHSFVVGVQRVNLKRGISGIHRPTLLPASSVRGLRSSELDSNDSIACVLDESFANREGPLLVRILLHPQTSAKQRDAAYKELADDTEIFDVRDVPRD